LVGKTEIGRSLFLVHLSLPGKAVSSQNNNNKKKFAVPHSLSQRPGDLAHRRGALGIGFFSFCGKKIFFGFAVHFGLRIFRFLVSQAFGFSKKF